MKLALVRAAEAQIPNDAFRVLTQMAIVALDTPNGKGEEPDLYFGGHVQLAQALGYGHGDRPSAASTAALKAVQRAVKPLVDHHVIDVRAARGRYPAVYDLGPLRCPYTAGQPLSTHSTAAMPETARQRLSTKNDTRRPPRTTAVVHLAGQRLSTPREEPSGTIRNHIRGGAK